MKIERRTFLLGALATLAAANYCIPRKSEQVSTPKPAQKSPEIRLSVNPNPPEIAAQRAVPRDHINPRAIPFLTDRNPDQIYRAASVVIYDSQDYRGHAALVENNGELMLYTIKHLLINRRTNRPTREGVPLFAHVPGVDYFNVDFSEFRYQEREGDMDPPAWYQLPRKPQAELRSAVLRGVIRPLSLTSKIPQIGEQFVAARADIGGYTFHRVLDIRGYDVLLDAEGKDMICHGRSGGALLKRLPDGEVLPEVYGVWAQGAGDNLYNDPLGRVSGPCYNRAVIKRN